MAIEMEGMAEKQVPSHVQCPECEHDIPVNPDWQEGDTFSCPSCSTGVQITGVDPLWIDFAPENDDTWDAEEDADEIALEDVEEEEEEEADDEDEGTIWTESVSRRISSLRPSRTRKRVRKEGLNHRDDDTVLLTPEGAERLRKELENLETIRLPKVTAWLSESLAEGFEEEDVTELEEARSELSLIEVRIRKLRNLLASADILQEPENKESVELGSRVTVVEGDEEPETYRIVSPAEADPLNGFISHVSPLGRVLIGKRVDDLVTVQSPDGPIEFRILVIH